MAVRRVLITGGAGYIGGQTVLAFLAHGYQVVVLDDLSTGLRSVIPDEVPFFEADVGDRTALSCVFSDYRFDAVIHLAGSATVSESLSDPAKYFRNNSCASRALFESCVEYHVPRIILSSTAAVYGGESASPVAESAPIGPANPYGASKALAELALQEIATTHGLQFACLRYFNVVGADPEGRAGPTNPAAGHLFKMVAQAAAQRRPGVDIFGTDYDTPDGTCIRDYIHVSDLADLHLAALSHLNQDPGNLVLNCGYGRGYSVREVIHAFQQVSGVDFEVRAAARRLGDVSALVADISLLQERLVWRPQYDDLDAMVTSALAWEGGI